MKKKDIIFGIGMYFGCIIFAGAMMAAADVIGTKKTDCDKFYAIEIIVPITPVACLLSKQVYP